MSRCKDPEIGRLIHAYELDQLDTDQRQSFEEHLLVCNYCFEEASQFDSVSELLRRDSDVARTAARAAGTEQRRNWVQRAKELLWPTSRPVLLRPAVAYLALALLLYPAYRGLQTGDSGQVQSTQTLIMSGTRGGTGSTASADQALTLVFRTSTASVSDTLVVAIVDQQGTSYYTDSSYVVSPNTRMGSITLQPAVLPPGEYSLKVSAIGEESPTTYRFNLR